MIGVKTLYGNTSPYVVLFFACCFLASLVIAIRPDVFFSGDAGLKLLVLKQLVSGGDYRVLESAHPAWVQHTWNKGFFPFQPPFVYANGGERIFSFPPVFQVISAPLYKWFGYRGMHIIPCLSMVALWAWFLNTAISAHLNWRSAAAGLFILALCSPITLYGAMYWEHSLAVLLIFSGAVYLVRQPSSLALSVTLGLLTGLSVWFRPEALVLCSLLAVVVFYDSFRTQRLAHFLFCCSLAVSVSAFFLFNKTVYGSLLGAHSYQVLNEDIETRLARYVTLLTHINARLLIFFPIAAGFFAQAFYLLIKRPRVLQPAIYYLTIITLCYLTITPYFLPNGGGKQWGPRYFLPVIPIMTLVTCLGVRDLPVVRVTIKRWLSLLLVIVGYSFIVNVYIGGKTLRNDYAHRVSPVLEYLKVHSYDVIVVQNQYIAQEIAALFGSRNIFLAENELSAGRLKTHLKSAGVSRVIYIRYSSDNKMPGRNFCVGEIQPVIKGNYTCIDCRLGND